MLRIRDLHAGYGATPILFGVSLEVREGEAVALLGRNGMGKTTLMKATMGFLRPWRGAIEFDGRSLTGLRPHQIARLGVGLVPENRRIFPGLTVRENLELGLSSVAGRSAAVRQERLAAVFEHFPRLRERLDQPGRTLSGGEQQMLAIARVMMAGARIVLMDEPTQGLAPTLVRHIREMIAELKRRGVTVLLVEQNARMALSVCDRGYIMEKGTIVFEGPARELRESPVTREKLGV
jgi:branched-chain amino acid transport system ATP-binding protein